MSTRIEGLHIQGDGVVVGNNNQITVIKTRYGSGGTDRRSERRSDKGDDNPAVPMAIALTFAVTAGTYYFARHAHEVYATLGLIAGFEFLFALSATPVFISREAHGVALRTGAIALLSLLAALALFVAHQRYPTEITDLANASASIREFWCGLTVYGRQLSLLHAATTTLGLGVGICLLLPATLILVFFAAFPIEISGTSYLRIEAWTSWVWIVLATPLLVAACYAQSESGWNTWARFIGDPPSLIFCPNRK